MVGVDANGFAELADKYRLGGVVDEVDGGDFADLGAGLQGDNALAPGRRFRASPRSQRAVMAKRRPQAGLNSPPFPFSSQPGHSPPISQLYVVNRKMPRRRRLNGGGGSPERTALPARFPAIRD